MQAIDQLCQRLAKLPGFGPRSARRAALALLQDKEKSLAPLIQAMNVAAEGVHTCEVCGNLDDIQPCGLCQSPDRDRARLCVIEKVADLWAFERSNSYKGLYHVLGGSLSPLEGITPQQLHIDSLLRRCLDQHITEVIIATSLSVEGQVTAQYIVDLLQPHDVHLTRLGHGMPAGGDLDYMDDATIQAALFSRVAM